MRHQAITYLTGLPAFAAYFGVGLLLLALFTLVYVRLTPFKEIALIRQGNVAAASSLGGAIIGFVLPLSSVIQNSVSLLDMLIWSSIALLVQFVAFVIARLLVPGISQQIQQGQLASGVLMAAVAIALGLLNAACMTW